MLLPQNILFQGNFSNFTNVAQSNLGQKDVVQAYYRRHQNLSLSLSLSLSLYIYISIHFLHFHHHIHHHFVLEPPCGRPQKMASPLPSNLRVDDASPDWLNKGDNAWQLTAATLVGLQSVPGLVILYGSIEKRNGLWTRPSWPFTPLWSCLYAGWVGAVKCLLARQASIL